MERNVDTSFGNITITVTPDKMYQTASLLEEKAKNTDSLLDELINTMKNTIRYWEGNVAETERSKLNVEESNFKCIVTNLKNYAYELKNITAIYETAEKENINESSCLPSNILS